MINVALFGNPNVGKTTIFNLLTGSNQYVGNWPGVTIEKKEGYLNKDIKIVDFGTRRRFSAQWHEHVLRRLIKEVPENLIGTSNPWFAHKYGIKAVGTYAHEMPMVYA